MSSSIWSLRCKLCLLILVDFIYLICLTNPLFLQNGLSISYSTHGYASHLFNEVAADRYDIPVYKANGCDVMDVYDKTLQATNYSRKYSAPSLILYQELTRRFGHAATDRQHAYLDEEAIKIMTESDVVASSIVQAVEQYNAITYHEARDRFEEIGEMVCKLGRVPIHCNNHCIEVAYVRP